MSSGKMPRSRKGIRALVKSLTDFGAFVDIGGIDGLVHIRAPGRIKHPSEVLNVGDKISFHYRHG